MGRTFWILIGILGAALVVLILNHDSGTSFGFENSQFAAFIAMSVWAAFIAGAVFRRGQPVGDMLRNIVIWLFIILVLMAGYVFRFDLQDIGSRMTGGIIPGSPISSNTGDGREVLLIRSPNGHFEADSKINGRDVRFLIDTGATGIVLSYRDAERAGLDVDNLQFTRPVFTANGSTNVADARLGSLAVGTIVRNNVRVSISAPGKLKTNLLGQAFLESLASYERRGDRLILRD